MIPMISRLWDTSLAVTKPIEALCVQLSPNPSSCKAWAASLLNDNDPTDEESSMESSSGPTDLTEPVSQSTPKPAPNPLPYLSDQKRKCESMAAD